MMVDYATEYNNRARVPEHPAIIAGWEREAAAYRTARAEMSRLDVAYGPQARQKLDCFLPDDPTPDAPVVLFIHGGYWQSFDRSFFSHMADGPNGQGLVAAVPSYRVCPAATLDEIVADIRAVARMVWRELGRTIVACGHSAGGHLAAVLAATDWTALDHEVPRDLVRRALAISGVFDLAPLLQVPQNEALRLDEGAARRLSPAFWPVPAGVVLEAWVGGAESDEFKRQSRLIVAEWGARGGGTRYVEAAGANHFDVILPLADPASPMTRALAALCNGA